MSRTLTNPSAGNTFIDVLPIYNGGSNEITPPLALAAFDGIPISEYNTANGVAGLDANGKLPYQILPSNVSSSVAMMGPELLYLGETGEWTITNYNSATDYAISTSNGFITRAGSQVYYKAPTTPGTYEFTINDKTISIVVDDRFVDAPSILKPVNGTSNSGSGVVIHSSPFAVKGQGIDRSLHFNGTNKYLYKNPNGVSNSLKWTYSSWVKVETGSQKTLFSSGVFATNASYTGIDITNDKIRIFHDVNGVINWLITTDNTFNDANNYIHIDVIYDSAQAVASDRIKIYVNNVLQTVTGTYPNINTGSYINANYNYSIGAGFAGPVAGSFNNGYMSEVNFIDGKALIPDQFGYYDAGLAKWVPKPYEGTYGQNGFYLDFSDNSSATALGYDHSGRGNNFTSINIATSDFTEDGPFASIHQSTDWQLSDDAGFTNIISQSLADTVNLTNWNVNNLQVSTKYYVRCRYNGSVYGTSEWSSLSSFTTRDKWLPLYEQSIISAADKATGDWFGYSVAVSGDNTRIAVGAYAKTSGGTTASGQVYIFVNNNGVWTLESTLAAGDKAASDAFGSAVALNYDGSRLAVGAQLKNPGGTSNAGQVYVYTRSGTVWTQETTIIAADKVANDYFGCSVSFDHDANRLAIGAYNKTVGGTAGAGQVYVYSRSGVTWASEGTITAADKAVNDYFGKSVSVDGTGARIAIGASNKTVSAVTGAGKVYIYTRSGATWTEEITITASDKATGDAYGTSLAFSNDSNKLIVGAYAKDVSGIVDAGQIYMYSRSGIVYTEEAILTASDLSTNNWFGYGIDISDDNQTLVMGSPNKTADGVTTAGSIYIFN